MAKQRRSHSLEFKREAVRLVREQDMTYAQAGADLGIDKSTIRDWCRTRVRVAVGTDDRRTPHVSMPLCLRVPT